MITFAEHTGCVRCVCYSPDGSLLASGCEEGLLVVRSLRTQEVIRTWKFNDSVETLTFADDDQLLAVGLADGQMLVYELRSGDVQWNAMAHAHGVICILSHGSQWISSGWDCSITWWNDTRRANDFVSVPIMPKAAAIALAATPDGVLAIGLASTPQILLAHHPLGSFENVATDSPIESLQYAPDGTLLAAGNSRGVIELRTPSSQVVRTLTGHTGVVYGLAFTPDGQRLISTGGDATARIWHVATGQQQHVFQWHQRWATCLAISPDGLTVATGGADQRVMLWDLPD